MKVIITFTFCCDNLWKSKFMALEKPGKLGEILLCGHPDNTSAGSVDVGEGTKTLEKNSFIVVAETVSFHWMLSQRGYVVTSVRLFVCVLDYSTHHEQILIKNCCRLQCGPTNS